MSIYGTRCIIGDTEDASSAGRVGYYGGSHLYAPLHTRGEIDTADVPAWCVPGHEHDHENDVDRGEWLRLGIIYDSDDTLRPQGTSVLIDEDAARSLRDELSAWLALPKVKAVTG